MRNIYVVRPVGFNVGNHVIFSGLKNLVREYFGEEVNFVSVPATSKYDSFGRPGLSSASIYEINQYGDGVIVGGGNLLENGELDVDPTALAALRPPLMLFSVSWGRVFDDHGALVPRTDSLPDALVERLLEKASVVVARDGATQEFMQARCDRPVILGGCPSLLLARTTSPDRRESDSEEVGNLISVRHPALMSISPRHQSRVRHHIRLIVEHCRDRGEVVRLLCHDHRDLSFASSFPDVEYLYEEDLAEFLVLVRRARRLITYRLHSFIPAVVFETHAVNISYDERASSAIDTLGLGAWDVSMFGSQPVADCVIPRLESRADFEAALARSAPIRSSLIEAQREAMASFFSEVVKYRGRLVS